MADSDPTTSFSDDDLKTWASLATVLEWLPPALDAQLQREFGLTHFEYGVLFALADAVDHTLRMSVLASYANSSLSRLSRAVSRLEARGSVRREPDPTNRRYIMAILTDVGLRQYEAATPLHVRNVYRLVLDPLTRPQRKQLLDITRRVAHAIRENGEWTGATAGGDSELQSTG